MRKKELLAVLKEMQKKGESVGVWFTLYGKSGHFCSGKILAVNESFIQLEGSHEIYFDQPHCSIDEIIAKGKTLYQRTKKPPK
ncbi:hypothetical protein H5T58_02270 [Candidatus Parcubacteria bacterium]|nr:hypothetical protein [Candidatus Parcubacteria bacterium]